MLKTMHAKDFDSCSLHCDEFEKVFTRDSANFEILGELSADWLNKKLEN